MLIKNFLIATIAAATALALAACQGSLASRLLDESFGAGGVQVLDSSADAATMFLVDAIKDTVATVSILELDLEGLPSGTLFTLTVTESELQAAVDHTLATSGYGESINIQDVKLGNGYITSSFALILPPFNTVIPGTTTLEITVDAGGHPVFTVVSAEFGGLVAPDRSLTTLNHAIEEATRTAQDGAPVDVKLTDLMIADGTVTVTGRLD